MKAEEVRSLQSLLATHQSSNLRAISKIAENLANKTYEAGFKKASGLLDAIYIEADQAANGIGELNWSKWIDFAQSSYDDVKAVASLSPEQSSKNAAPIRTRQNRLRPKIVESLKSIGGTKSIKGAFVGTDVSPIQLEWRDISNQIRGATLLKEDREALLATQKELLHLTQDVVIKAGKEGKDISDVFSFYECLLLATTTGEKIKCFFAGDLKYITIASIIGVVILSLFLLRPYVMLLTLKA
jgi:hypothetical protein